MEMTSKAKILVLFANAYDMKDEAGKQVSGTTVHYLFWGENGEQFAPQVSANTSAPVGYQRAKCSLPFNSRNDIPYAPAVYEGDFVMSVGSDGKPVLKLSAVKFLSKIECSAPDLEAAAKSK